MKPRQLKSRLEKEFFPDKRQLRRNSRKLEIIKLNRRDYRNQNHKNVEKLITCYTTKRSPS